MHKILYWEDGGHYADKITKQDVTVGLAVTGCIVTLGTGAELAAAGAAGYAFIMPALGLISNTSAALTDKNGDSGLQQMTNDPLT